jgi:sortase (surface protein transpeptidase)
MSKFLQTIITKITAKRRQLLLATVVVVGIVGASVIYDSKYQTVEAPTTSGISVTEGITLPKSLPTRIRIPSIGVDAPFETPLGLTPAQEIEVPVGYETVGYYENGPTPGELGPAVILGHVDSYEGPAVFFSLGQLKDGDEIEIEREDGSVAIFAVTSLERHAQSGFPTEKVYSDTNHAGLRLITCTGVYDRNSLRYTHNLIVFAKLVATSSSKTTP